jgi:hypothetical protein
MSGELHHLPNPRWAFAKLLVAVLAGVLLLPVLLLAVIPMLIMFVPIAVVGIPVIAPVMLSGKLAARWEVQARTARAASATRLKSAPLVVR